MKTVKTVAGLREELARYARPLGLVPTMGALHAGHVALVHRARLENGAVCATIFVNPTQFGPREDFEAYPRDVEADLRKLERAGTDVVFTPSLKEMYPDGFDTHVDVGRVAARLEGAHRPGHFRGVATVVCKLLAATRPDRAYFGQKDAQQCVVVKRLNADLDLGAEIVVVPTVREPDGLALSSRNQYMSPPERRAATVIHLALERARSMRVDDAEAIRREMRSLIEAEPLARVDYASVADPDTLEELDVVTPGALASLAVYVGETRLIDNATL